MKEPISAVDDEPTVGSFYGIVGRSAALQRVLRLVERVASTDAAVLIRGETGTGKELIADLVHRLSARERGPLVKFNCTAIPNGLLDSELFGHERGAFTGAIARRIGRFELANRGTLFLDEIGDLPPDLQPKLLRVLEERGFERIGGTQSVRTDVRVVTATNRPLEDLVEAGQFRSDLYFRLNVFPIDLPPLRERTEDIPLLVRHFVDHHARRLGRRIEVISPGVMEQLVRHRWPGNVRELQHVVQRAVILSHGGRLELPQLEEPVRIVRTTNAHGGSFEDAMREHILQVLGETHGIVAGPRGAAARLGLKRTTLQSKMAKLGIVPDDVAALLTRSPARTSRLAVTVPPASGGLAAQRVPATAAAAHGRDPEAAVSTPRVRVVPAREEAPGPRRGVFTGGPQRVLQHGAHEAQLGALLPETEQEPGEVDRQNLLRGQLRGPVGVAMRWT